MTIESHIVKANLIVLLDKEPHLEKDLNLLLIRYWTKYDKVKQFADLLNLGATKAEDIIHAVQSLKVDKLSKNVQQNAKSRQQYLPF